MGAVLWGCWGCGILPAVASEAVLGAQSKPCDSPPQEERDSAGALQPPAPRGCLRQHSGAPHRPLWGPGAVRPGQARLEAPRGRLNGHAPGTRSAVGLHIGSQGGFEEPSRGSATPRGPNRSVPGLGWAGECRLQAHPRLPAAPARHRALTPPRSPPAVPGLPAWSSPTPLLSRLPRRLAFSGLPVPNALLSVGRNGVSCLTAETPLQWGHLFACVLVPLPASSCGVQLSPRARTGICAKSAAPEPCGAISGTPSGRKLPEERPVTGGAGSQHSTSCPSPASSAGSAGGLAACLTPRGDVCVVVGPAQQPSGTLNKALASAALLHLRPLGRPNPVPVLTPCWGRCVVPLTPWCRAGSAPVPEFLFCPLSGASSTPRERSHVSLLVSPASHGAEMRARGWPSSFLPPQPSRSGLAGSPPLNMGTSRLPPAPNPTTPPLSARGQTL